MTPRSGLRKELQRMDDAFSKVHKVGGVRMVEQGGTTLSSLLVKADPWGGAPCGRGEECFPCTTAGDGRVGQCSRESVTYRLICLDCESQGVKATYVGETGRSAFLRGKEHTRGARLRDPKNPMVRHSEDQHNMVEGIPPFKMEILRTFAKPLQRQVSEAVAIEGGAGGADYMLNSKAEWGGAKIPRLTVEVGARVRLLEYQGGAQGARGVAHPTPRQMEPPQPDQTASRELPQADGPTIGAPLLPTTITRGGQELTRTQATGRGRKRSQTVRGHPQAALQDAQQPSAVCEIERPARKRRKVHPAREEEGMRSHTQPSIMSYLLMLPETDKYPMDDQGLDRQGGHPP